MKLINTSGGHVMLKQTREVTTSYFDVIYNDKEFEVAVVQSYEIGHVCATKETVTYEVSLDGMDISNTPYGKEVINYFIEEHG